MLISIVVIKLIINLIVWFTILVHLKTVFQDRKYNSARSWTWDMYTKVT